MTQDNLSIPSGYCQCGCGERPRTGRPFLRGHHMRLKGLPDPPYTADENGCWNWVGFKDRLGYGRVMRDGCGQGAHRYVYQQQVGPIPEGMELDHLCRNPSCVNPDHLEPVSHAENMRRSPLTTPLTQATVDYIRSSPKSGPVIATELGINRNTVTSVRRHETWAVDGRMSRRPNRQQQAALDVLRAAGAKGVTGMELQAAGAGRQYPQRIKELRDTFGYDIPFAEYVGKAANNSSIYRYVLRGEPTVPSRRDPSGPLLGETTVRDGVRSVSRPEGTGGTLFDLDPDEEGRSAITGQPMRTSTGWVKRKSEAA